MTVFLAYFKPFFPISVVDHNFKFREAQVNLNPNNYSSSLISLWPNGFLEKGALLLATILMPDFDDD